MRKTTSGFSIVELLIVITVIAILAGISLVVYNGTQQRARTSQTLATAEQWVKGLMIYKARNGGLPTMNSCLGAGYGYNSDGLGASGTGQCYQNTATGYTVDSAFSTAMSTYMSGSPSPAMVSAVNSTTFWYRGLMYSVSGGVAQITFVLDKGQTCPNSLAEYDRTQTFAMADGDVVCVYAIGSTTSYNFN